jgi:hypothetical protein
VGTFALLPDLTFHQISLRTGEDFWAVQFEMIWTSAAGGRVCVDLSDYVLVENGAVKEKHSYVDGSQCRPLWAELPADSACLCSTT